MRARERAEDELGGKSGWVWTIAGHRSALSVEPVLELLGHVDRAILMSALWLVGLRGTAAASTLGPCR